jgi:hypothetical protein
LLSFLPYVFSNHQLVKNKMSPFPGFQGLTLVELSKPLLRQWKLWMAERGTSGRMINGVLLALQVPVRRAFDYDIIPVNPFAGVSGRRIKRKSGASSPRWRLSAL